MKRRYWGHSALSLLLACGASFFTRTALAACADGTWEEESEQCDDGNSSSGDGCSDGCRIECVAVVPAATDHTCLHGALGPFQTVSAQPYPGFVYTDVSQSHTYYTVTLAGEAGVDHSAVLYFPVASGAFAIYSKTRFSLTLRDAAGEPVPVFFEHAVTTCSAADSLTWVTVYESLSDQEEYTLDIGPVAASTVSLAVEYLPSFSEAWYRDGDRDGWGSELVGRSWCTSTAKYPSRGEDCDDDNGAVHPDAVETCNGIDDNCDQVSDLESSELCAASPRGAVCLDSGSALSCGCKSDADCGPRFACHSSTQRCESPSSGAGGGGAAPTGAGGDGGGDGEHESEGGAGGEVPANPPGAGGDRASGGVANGGGADPTPRRSAASDGGCQLVGPSATPGGLVLLSALLGLSRRRRSRHG